MVAHLFLNWTLNPLSLFPVMLSDSEKLDMLISVQITKPHFVQKIAFHVISGKNEIHLRVERRFCLSWLGDQFRQCKRPRSGVRLNIHYYDAADTATKYLSCIWRKCVKTTFYPWAVFSGAKGKDVSIIRISHGSLTKWAQYQDRE